MPGLSIYWEYLTGYAVATAQSRRNQSEWPPHPVRVFMAMAAAWFETAPEKDDPESARRAHEEEGRALKWLESLDPPDLWLPATARQGERTAVTFYVPVNDRAGPASATLQSAPALTRSKQARNFPKRYIGNQPVALHWPGVEDDATYRQALSRLCRKVTRIGHSSSLVNMWLAKPGDQPALDDLEHWQPDEALAELHCRVMATGLLASLPEQTRIPEIERFAEQFWRVSDTQFNAAEAKAADDSTRKRKANKAFRAAKQEFEDQTGQRFKAAVAPPPRLRPSSGLWAGYRRSRSPKVEIAHTVFDTDLLILAANDRHRLPSSSTLAVARALRNTLMSTSPVQPVPAWVSGHKSDGSPGDSAEGHLGVIPLPFVGRRHADGHLLGMALVFPRSISLPERGRILGPLLLDQSGHAKEIILRLGPIGSWSLTKRGWNEQRQTLQPETWTALPHGSSSWATVTPVVLDKFPKADRRDRLAWEAETRALIIESCRRAGLPDPIEVDIDTTSWQIGSPRAFIKSRRLRDHANAESSASARLGEGFPALPPKGRSASRPQVHVYLQFEAPVCGPVVLGAGRFRGYGLFKPTSTTR